MSRSSRRSSLFVRGVIVMAGLLPNCLAAQEPAQGIAVLDDASAWARLPPLEAGQRQELPVWARMLADSLPRTTAAMIELDALHRAHSPLGGILAAKVRKTVAEANRCDYSVECAEADLARAYADDASHRPVAVDTADEERLIFDFARRLTLEADTITNEEVARLIEKFGERKLVALVLLTAHANFQDRLLLSLGAIENLGEPLPPFDGRFQKNAEDIIVPDRTLPESPDLPAVPERVDDPEWRSLDFAALARSMENQRQRPGRIRVPAWEEVVDSIPPERRPNHPIRILWTLVCRGYQPQLASGWSDCLRIFAEESKQDRVFEESVFWVITRTIHCFY